MFKRHLESLIRRARGAHAFPRVLQHVQEMDEAEAEQWYRLLQNVEADAKSAGERDGARQPWKHGGFPR